MNINNNSVRIIKPLGTSTNTPGTSVYEYNCEYRPLTVKSCCADNCPRIFNPSAWEGLSKHCIYRQAKVR
ncbi:MAG: hypothetical protein E7011_03050 [Alphaproteobacteria bacterium]|nr:hypothetical protein [Alphaproteobacteria bacterium]